MLVFFEAKSGRTERGRQKLLFASGYQKYSRTFKDSREPISTCGNLQNVLRNLRETYNIIQEFYLIRSA